MKQQPIIIALLAVAMLAAVGCANKKKIAMREAEQKRIQDSIALVQAQAEAAAEAARQAEAARLAELERQRVQDSIAAAEAARKAMVQTLNIPRMTVTMVAQGKQLSTPATMRWQRGTGLVVSIQPFAGIEMARVELDADYLTIIDKINRRYTRLTYAEIEQMGARTSIDEIDAWIDQNILARKSEPQLTLQVSRAGINGSATIYTASMPTDVRVNIQPTNVSSYRQVTLEQLMKGF